MLEIVQDWGWVIGLEFSSSGISSTSADMNGEQYNIHSKKLEPDLKREKIIRALISSVRRQISFIQRINQKPIYRIGVAISGLVDETRGVSISFPRLEDWYEVPLKEILEEEFSIPVIVENRITATTLAEHLFGHHKSSSDALLFHLGPGLGMGMILNGKVRRGSKWSVGEFGHIAVMENGPLCYCGKRGCLESVASDYALVAQVKEAIRNGVNTRILDFADTEEEVTSSAICRAAADGDRLASGMIERMGHYIAIGVANLLNVLGPEVIFFAGNMVDCGDIFLDCIKRNMHVHTLEYIEKHVKIEKASFGTEAGLRGAVTLALYDFFTHSKDQSIPEVI